MKKLEEKWEKWGLKAWKNCLEHFRRLSMFQLTTKFQKKVFNGFRVACYAQTDKGDSEGPSTDGGETKNYKRKIHNS